MNRISIIFFILTITSNILAQSTDNEFKPSGKPIVQVFATTFYEIEDNRYSFKFNRAHLGYQYQFSPNWSAKIIIDRGRATSVGEITVSDSSGNVLTVENNSDEGSYYTMYLKFASLQWKVNEKFTIKGGAILQNHYITQERFWGLRYVAQTFQDLYWKMPSSDLGFIATYKLNNILSFDAAITNGEGPREIQDAFGKVKFASGVDINPSKKIQTRIYYHNRQSKTNSKTNEQLYSTFIGYKPNSTFRIGGEFNYMSNLDNIDNLNSYGFSFYSAYQISLKAEVFARYDRLFYDVNDNITSNNRCDGNTIIAGVSYSPVKGVNVSLNYQGWLPDENTDENADDTSILLSMAYKF